MGWPGLSDFFAQNRGNPASVTGLVASVATFVVATKARQAAEAARTAARRQSLTEVLQDAVRRNEQVGLFLSQRRWDIVWLRAQEIAGVTSVVMTRWPHELTAISRDNLLRSRRLSSSIASEALVASGESPTPQALARMSQAQGRVAQLLEKTKKRIITWEPTARDDEFVSTLGGTVSFTIGPWGEGRENDVLTMRDGLDRVLLTIDSDATVEVSELYSEARRQALNVDESLDSVLDQLARME